MGIGFPSHSWLPCWCVRLLVATCFSSPSWSVVAPGTATAADSVRVALIGNNGGTHFPTRDYGGIEISVEHAAWGLHVAGVAFFVVVPGPHASGGVGAVHECRTGDYPFEVVVADGYGERFADAAFVTLSQRRGDFDIIWAQSHWAAWGLSGLGKPLIVTLHDSTARQEGWLVPLPHVRTRFVSEAQRQGFVREEWERNASFVVHHGLPDEEFRCPGAEEVEEEEKAGGGGRGGGGGGGGETSASGGGAGYLNNHHYNHHHHHHHLFVAGLHWEATGGQTKGLRVFVDLARRHPAERFVAHGAGDFPDVVKWLHEVEAELPNFRFLGALSRGAAHRYAFCGAATLVMPTQIPEAFGLTVIEALSKGTPVVASDKGALPELLRLKESKEGRAGGLLDLNESVGIAAASVDEMSAALLQWRRYNRSFIREHARDHFHLSRTTAKMLQHSWDLLRDLGLLPAHQDAAGS